MTKLYDLIWLDSNLKKSGILGRCFRYEFSGNKNCLHIVYLDKYINRQFLFVFRSSRLCYQIYFEGRLITARTSKTATAKVLTILSDIISENDYMKVMTVAEYNDMPNLTHKQRLDLFERLKNKSD